MQSSTVATRAAASPNNQSDTAASSTIGAVVCGSGCRLEAGMDLADQLDLLG